MGNQENNLQPILSHVEPVLAVHDVSASITYWQEVLGFPEKWMWGEPPVHGAVSWHKAFIQFTRDPALADASKYNSLWIRVRRVQELYKIHQRHNAEIVAPLEDKPWGMAQYTVKDINGYFIHFAGPIPGKEKNATSTPPVRIVARTPAVHEYRALASAVGWSPSESDEKIMAMLNAAIFAVVAENTLNAEVVGCALLLGDHASFYYVKDVMVLPNWQGNHVGSALMNALNEWLDKNGANHALVALISGENLEPFYQQFGFTQAFSMIRHIQRDDLADIP